MAALYRHVGELEDAAVAVLQAIPVGLDDRRSVFGNLIPKIQFSINSLYCCKWDISILVKSSFRFNVAFLITKK